MVSRVRFPTPSIKFQRLGISCVHDMTERLLNLQHNPTRVTNGRGWVSTPQPYLTQTMYQSRCCSKKFWKVWNPLMTSYVHHSVWKGDAALSPKMTFFVKNFRPKRGVQPSPASAKGQHINLIFHINMYEIFYYYWHFCFFYFYFFSKFLFRVICTFIHMNLDPAMQIIFFCDLWNCHLIG